MNIFEIILISISLASDAFAVSLGKGLVVNKLQFKHLIIIGLYFGTFQAIMPFISYHLTKYIGIYLISYSYLISFFLLFLIGIGFLKEQESIEDDDFRIKTILPLAIGTSIDALVIGVTFTLMEINIISSCILIGIITFLFSSLALYIGFKIKKKIPINPKKLGGIVLIMLSLKMLIQYLNL